MLKNKKIIFFSLFLIAFLLFLSSNVYASIDVTDSYGVSYSFPDAPENNNGLYVIYASAYNKASNNHNESFKCLTLNKSWDDIKTELSLNDETKDYFLFTSVYHWSAGNEREVFCFGIGYYDDNNNLVQVKFDDRNLNYFTCYSLSSDGLSWESPTTGYEFKAVDIELDKFIEASSVNIYRADYKSIDNLNSVVFQAPLAYISPIKPEEPEIVEETILKPAIVETGMETTLNELISLLPLLIACLVGFLGLRKGLQMVLQLLANS